MKIAWRNPLLVAFKCTQITQWDLLSVLNQSEPLMETFQWIQSSESSGTLLKTECQKEMDYLFSRKIQNHFRLSRISGFVFFSPPNVFCSFAISRQLLSRASLNMYERLLKSHVHFRLEHVSALWQNIY